MSRIAEIQTTDGWEYRSMADVCEVITDFVANGSFASLRENVTYRSDPGYAILIRVTDFSKKFRGPFVFIDKKAYDFLKKSQIHPGDIVLGNVGSIGTAFEAPDLGYPLSIAPNALLVRSKAKNRFLYFLLLSPQLQEHLRLLSSKIAQPKFNKTQFRGIEIPLPPLPEQKKIAHILSTVQRAIEAQERIIQTTTELKKALMHQLFTEGLRNEPQKQTEIGPIPESWEVVTFDRFATLQRGYDLRKQDFKKGEVPVIGATQVIGYHDTANVKAPGVTVVRSGSSAGMPLFITEDFWAHNVLLYVKNFHGNVPKFVYYKILAMDLTQYRQGVAVPTLNRNTFSAIELSLPSPEEQQEIADALDSVENKRNVAERKSAQLQDLFRTLLHELMTAKTRVHELNVPAP